MRARLEFVPRAIRRAPDGVVCSACCGAGVAVGAGATGAPAGGVAWCVPGAGALPDGVASGLPGVGPATGLAGVAAGAVLERAGGVILGRDDARGGVSVTRITVPVGTGTLAAAAGGAASAGRGA